jgi:tetratricopeptide (TPR) repeat protein
MNQGKYDLAQREYAAAAAAAPGDAEARAGMIAAQGLAKLQAGQVQAAVDDLNASISIRPLPEAYEALGRIYAANGTRGAAIDAFGEAIRLRPNYAQAYLGRAEARRERAGPLRDMTELGQAADDYTAVLLVKADLPEALFGLGVTRFLLNDYAAAVESFDGALRTRPMFTDAKYARARSYFELTQYQEALKDLVDLPRTFDSYARSCSIGMAFFALGDAALTAKDEPRAIELFTQSSQAFSEGLATRPDDPRIKFWSLLASQNALPGLAGKGSRAKERLIMQFAPGKPRPAPAPTATLVHTDACRRA